MSAPYSNYKIFINRIIQLHYHIKNKMKNIMEHLKCICVSQMINKSKSFMTDRVSGSETQPMTRGYYTW